MFFSVITKMQIWPAVFLDEVLELLSLLRPRQQEQEISQLFNIPAQTFEAISIYVECKLTFVTSTPIEWIYLVGAQ